MTDILSDTQRRAILDAYAAGYPADASVVTRSYRTRHALVVTGAVARTNWHHYTFHGLVMAGVDMDAIHEQALALWTDERCTHGDGCPVHPDTHNLHNFDVPALAEPQGPMDALSERLHTAQVGRTPAEACTGISDRTAAALADVAEVWRTINSPQGFRPADVRPLLDRIERALRGER